ncbi:MAG: type IX secretion system membrane protein PorP/SprF, partial [Flavobacteriales bacterium]
MGVGHNLKDIGKKSRQKRHYILTGGKEFSFNKQINYVASGLLKFAPVATPALDLNLLVKYRDRIEGGISYRINDAIAGVFQV